MSAIVSTPLLVEKKVRVPTTLPAKYGKFIQFGYYFMNKLNAVEDEEDSSVPIVDEKLFLEKLRIYDTLENQQALVQEFFDSSKTINQNLRKMMMQHKRDIAKQNKPIKEKKTRQPRQKKEVVQEEGTEQLPKEKKTRVKKVKAPTTEDQLVNELVQLASQQDLPQQIVTAVEQPLSAKKDSAKKDSAKAAVSELLQTVAPIPVKEPKVKEVKEPKVKEVKEPKAKEVKEVKAKEVKVKEVKVKEVKEPKVKEPKVKEVKDTTVTPTEEDEELQVSVFEYNLQKYLIDDLNNVYDFHSQDKIGTLHNGILILS
jgi:hypothetical protein